MNVEPTREDILQMPNRVSGRLKAAGGIWDTDGGRIYGE